MQGRLSYSCPRQHAAKVARTTGRGQGAWVGHLRNRVSPLPNGCVGSQHLPYASLALGLAIPIMANPDGPSRSPDGFRSHGYSSPRLWGHQHREKGEGVKTTSQLPKKKCKWQSCHYRPQAKYTLCTRPWCRKAHKALRGVAGLERPSARFKGPLTSRKPRTPPLFGGRSPACAVFTRTHAHTTGVVRC